MSTSKTTWSEQRSKFPKRTKRFSSFLPCLKQHSFSFLSTPFRRHFVLAELVQMFHLHKASLNSWTNSNNKCVWLFVFFECEFFSSYLFVPMMKSSQVPKYERRRRKNVYEQMIAFYECICVSYRRFYISSEVRWECNVHCTYSTSDCQLSFEYSIRGKLDNFHNMHSIVLMSTRSINHCKLNGL